MSGENAQATEAFGEAAVDRFLELESTIRCHNVSEHAPGTFIFSDLFFVIRKKKTSIQPIFCHLLIK